ncbi:glycosyltransferase family 39 protein [Roseibium sp. MMSF_3544]|uniref:glycosyltransferase family 39 protein n=1 Tax=unclassified Roseibium TaxID=2629323 RepID=UPI00273D3221|nr:glycosyltransferase family 39 protein [Roseibium sp. MMSF_3544]
MTASRAALFYAAGLCLLYGLVPTLTFPGPPLDVVEGFAWGRELQLGYTKHPPMQAWLLELSHRLTGGYYVGGYWLSALSAAFGYLFVWKIARRLALSKWQAFWSIVLTSVTFYFTLPMPEFNPNTLQIPVWSGMILLFLKIQQKPTLLDWVLLGALTAFGLYTKYFVFLLVGTIGLYTLVFADSRRLILSPGPWLCTLVCAALLVPHILWLLETDFLTLQYAASRSKPAVSFFDHLFNPLNFFFAQVGNHAGLFLIVLAGLGWSGLKRYSAERQQSQTRLAAPGDRFLLWFAFVPLAVIVLASAITGNEFEHMWGTPMFVLSGIVAVRFFALPGLWPFPRRAIVGAIAIQAIFLVVIFGQAVLEPFWKEKQTRIHYPAKDVAIELADIWKSQTGTDLAYVAGDMWSAANVTLHAPGRPSMFYLHSQTLSPWIDLEDVQQKGVMIVWRGDRDIPLNELLVFYPDAVRDGSKSFRYRSSADIPEVVVNWLIIPPGEVAEVPAN